MSHNNKTWPFSIPKTPSLQKTEKQDNFSHTLPQAILFDWDNTLVDSWKISYLVFNKTLIHFGFSPIAEQEFLSQAQEGLSVKEKFPLVFGKEWMTIAHFYYKTYKNDHLNLLKPLKGAKELLIYLKNKNVPMAIVSNKKQDLLLKEVEFLNWNEYFGGIIGSCDGRDDKPSDLPGKIALESVGVPPSKEVLFVGDTWVDFRCARNLGCFPVLLGKADLSEEDVQDLKRFPDCIALGTYLGIKGSRQ